MVSAVNDRRGVDQDGVGLLETRWVPAIGRLRGQLQVDGNLTNLAFVGSREGALCRAAVEKGCEREARLGEGVEGRRGGGQGAHEGMVNHTPASLGRALLGRLRTVRRSVGEAVLKG